MMRLKIEWSGLFLSLALAGCLAPGKLDDHAQEQDLHMVESEIEELVHSLYTAFCFDPGSPADWEGMQKLFAEGASFVSPIRTDQAVRITGSAEFIGDFKRWIESSAVGATGLHERVLKTRIEVFANIAHVFVTFEGFVPGEVQAQTLGVDSLQLVLDRGQWKVASFASQYTSPELGLPGAFKLAGME